MSAAEATIAKLEARLHVERQRGEVFDARCPAHPDRSASLVFGYGTDDATGERNGKVVVHCHAGCETPNVLHAVGMTMTDLMPEPHLVAEYPYLDEDGLLLWTVERWEPKDFRVRPGLPPAGKRRLYRSEWLRAARTEGRPVWVVEGEKDADALAAKGHIAVCGVGGAGKWLAAYTDQLVGLDVMIIADADDAGRTHARAVARALDGRARSVHLAMPSYGKDISDQLAAGYELDTVVPLSVDEDLDLHRADQVLERPVAWLWPGLLPMGKLVMIEGDPGDGKSVLTCDLAARFSRGAELPDHGRCPLGPVDVVMVSAEDDPEDTIVPRLRVAGADRRRIHLVTGGSTPDSPFDLVRDLATLESFIQTHGVKLVVIDPLMAFIPAGVDSYRDSDVRRVLYPISRMAMRTGATVLVVRHLTKGRTKAITAGGGSIGFIGAARVGFLVAPHPEDESKRVVSCVKINVGRLPDPIAYRIAPDAETPDVPLVRWDEERPSLTAQDLLDGVAGLDERDAKADARAFLVELLDRNPVHGLKWIDVVRAGKKEGHSEHTLRRVRAQVATSALNPITTDGIHQRGTFWFPLGVSARTHSEPALAPVRNLPTVGPPQAGQAGQAPTPPGDAGDHAALPRSGPCDQCGSEQAITFGPPFHARRCAAHNPLLDHHEEER